MGVGGHPLVDPKRDRARDGVVCCAGRRIIKGAKLPVFAVRIAAGRAAGRKLIVIDIINHLWFVVDQTRESDRTAAGRETEIGMEFGWGAFCSFAIEPD